MKLELILATADQEINATAIAGRCNIDPSRPVKEILSPQHLMLASRHNLDKTHEWSHVRQIIPYIVVMNCRDEILAYTRTPKGGEEKLHNSVSVGWGGHIDLADVVMTADSRIDIENTIFDCALRELTEELGLVEEDYIQGTRLEDPMRALTIVSDEDAVGRVHLGFVMRVKVRDESISKIVVEDSANILGWIHPSELLRQEDALEGWSRALLKAQCSADIPYLL